MRHAWLSTLAALIAMLLASCGGSAPADLGAGGNNLGQLDYSLSTPPESTVQSTAVDGFLDTTEDALSAKATSSLPSGFIPRQGMHFTPPTAPGAGFSGRLDVRISEGSPVTDEYEGVLLYIFYVDPSSHACTQIDSSRGRVGNRVTFDIDCLGFFVIAENSAVPRPGDQFTVSAFADQSVATVGTVINFWATHQNGTDPISYTWDFGDGASATGDTVSHAYLAPGVYNIGLQATDAGGKHAPISSTPITISGNPVPLTDVTVSYQRDNQSPLDFTFSATVNGGTAPFTYAWDFDGDGTTDSSGAPPLIYTLPDYGLFKAHLQVTDATNATVGKDFILDARLLLFSLDKLSGTAPLAEAVVVDGRGLTPDDMTSIDFGDGNTLQTPLPNGYTYVSPGTFTAVAHTSTTLDGTPYPLDSAPVTVVVSPAGEDTLPLIQLTQPIQPDPKLGFKIKGLRFGASQGNRTVTLGGVALPIKSWSDNEIDVDRPSADLTDGQLLVTAPEGAPLPVSLNVLDGGGLPNLPAVQNILPRHVVPGQHIYIIGNGLDESDGKVKCGGVDCTPELLDNTGIVAILPDSLTPGDQVISVGLKSGGSLDFTIKAAATSSASPFIDPVAPAVRALNPASWSLVLSGNGFGSGVGDLVCADGVCLSTASWSPTSIAVSFPNQQLDGFILVLHGELPSNARPFAALNAPNIDSVTPPDAYVGLQVTITGSNFGASQGPTDQIYLEMSPGGAAPTQLQLPVVSWSDNQILVTIPQNANDGNVFVSKRLLSNGVPLNIIPPPPGTPGGGQI